ncbi:MAG: GFA family protein [Pseudomonadota bacterium]
MNAQPITGGCQCGAVRYRVKALGYASICHCRMCQKAFGNYFAPLVKVEGFEWTRGERKLFASSNLTSRGFCADCGTPLTLETRGEIEVAIATLDDPSAVSPECHVNLNDRVPAVKHWDKIPEASDERREDNDKWNATIVSYQHPDHDTAEWKVRK